MTYRYPSRVGGGHTTSVPGGPFQQTQGGIQPASARGGTPSATPATPGYVQIITDYLTQWGLKDLIPTVISLGKDSANTSDIIYLKLQQTDAWKKRFAGNEERVKNGLGVLSPAEYIALESQYKQTLRSYGLPDGFYDDKQSTDNWIGGDVSPSEVASRAQAAADLVYNSPPEALAAWNKFYGGTGAGGAIAAILDPGVAEPLIQQRVLASQIGGAALGQGLSTSSANAERFAKEGVTLSQAQQAYSDIAARLSTDQSAGARFGGALNQADEEAATLDRSGSAIQKQSTVYAEEASLFSGRGGAAQGAGNPGANY